jgi:hypothetical protein
MELQFVSNNTIRETDIFAILGSSVTNITSVKIIFYDIFYMFLTHCGRVTQICLFNTVKLGTSASSP